VAELGDGRHSTHDPLLIAAHAAGDLSPGDRARAEGLIDGCPHCGALAVDLGSIAAATAGLRRAQPARPRDFRISAADAARLRRGGGLRRWLRPLTGRRFDFARPLGSIATAIALVGLLAGSLTGILGGSTGGAAYESLATDSREVGSGPAAPAPAAGPAGSALILASAAASPGDVATRTAGETGPVPGPKGRAPRADGSIVAASLVLLAIGLGLLGGRTLARRLVGPAREP
jgi:hypothetical protein